MSRLKIIGIGLVTLLVFPALGFLIHLILEDDSFINVLDLGNWRYWKSLLGIIHGIILGLFALWISNSRLISESTQKYQNIIDQMDINFILALFLSFCAGVGEELFFRGVLQNYFGIWITAIFFVAIHGYLNPKNWRLSLYGIFLVLYSASLGFFKEEVSVWFSVYSHMFFDLVLFLSLKKTKSS